MVALLIAYGKFLTKGWIKTKIMICLVVSTVRFYNITASLDLLKYTIHTFECVLMVLKCCGSLIWMLECSLSSADIFTSTF